MYKQDPKQDIIKRTNILKILDNIQLLSTQTIGRYGSKDFTLIFYELMKKYTDFYYSVLNLETQKDANNLNKLYIYFYKKYDYSNFIRHLLSFHNDTDPNKSLTNFRIYPKKQNLVILLILI